MKILIVEDNPQTRSFFKEGLEDLFQRDAKFREAHSLETALNYLSQGGISVVLLDLNLPDSDGEKTFREIHAKHPEVPTVILTSNHDLSLAETMLREGAADFIVKGTKTENMVKDLFWRMRYAIIRHERDRTPAPITSL